MAKIGPYIRLSLLLLLLLLLLFILLLLLKHSLIFYKIDRSTNKQYRCDSKFEIIFLREKL